MSEYPRALTHVERELALWLLPEELPFYSDYHNVIITKEVIAEGRWGMGDLLIGSRDAYIDLTLGMTQVVAYGECMIGGETLTIGIHEPNQDDLVELQFSGIYPLPDDLVIDNGWSYSYWKPGMNCPATNTEVREITLYRTLEEPVFTLAISKANRSLWLHHHANGWNQLIPVTMFYDELLRTKRIRDAALITKPSTFFEKVDEFQDYEYRTALGEYNNRKGNKLDLNGLIISETRETKKSFLGKILGK